MLLMHFADQTMSIQPLNENPGPSTSTINQFISPGIKKKQSVTIIYVNEAALTRDSTKGKHTVQSVPIIILINSIVIDKIVAIYVI